MALTAPRQLYETQGQTNILEYPSAGNDIYYQGALMVSSAAGYADVPSDAAALIPLGVYTGRQGQEFSVASGAHDTIEIEEGYVWVPFSGAAQTDVGEVFYLADDSTVTKTIGSKTWGIMCKGFKTGYVRLDFAKPIKMA